MAVEVLAPVIEASVFTLGCMGIHAFRRHADRLTTLLGMIVIGLIVALIGSLEVIYGILDSTIPTEFLGSGF